MGEKLGGRCVGVERHDRVRRGRAVLNVMAVIPRTRVNGPGDRCCVWLQGCPIGCPGCFNPQSWEFRDAELCLPAKLVRRVLSLGVDGLTISGGEPMSQPVALGKFLEGVQGKLPLGVICFTGYDLAAVEGDAACAAILPLVDLLVSGPYIASLRTDRGIGGSSNKFFWYNPLPGRGGDIIDRSSVEFDRGVEVFHVSNDAIEVTGFPAGLTGDMARAGLRRLPVAGSGSDSRQVSKG